MISSLRARVAGLGCVFAFSLSGLSLAADIPLGIAADQPDLTWTTGTEHPFRGLADGTAKNGSSAKAVLGVNEQAWLEVEVPGPGVLDFWLRVPALFQPIDPYRLWQIWEVEVDGVKASLSGSTWPALILRGAGPHKVRWTCTAPDVFPDPDVETMSVGGVDQVSWFPATSENLGAFTGLENLTWTTGGDFPWTAAEGFGDDPYGTVFAPIGYTKGNSWLETKVTGPGGIYWKGLVQNNFVSIRPNITVDGGRAIPVQSYTGNEYGTGWQNYWLTIPAGEHVIRWNAECPGYDDPLNPPVEFDFSSAMAIRGASFSADPEGVAVGVHAPDKIFLEMFNAGDPFTSADAGAWQTQPGGGLLIQAVETGWMNVRWRMPVSDDYSERDLGCYLPGDFVYLNSLPDDDQWQNSRVFLEKGEWLKFQSTGTPNDYPVAIAPQIATVSTEPVPGATLEQAADVAGVVNVETIPGYHGWHGIADAASAHDGVDVAISVPYERYYPNRMEKVITGPATLSYWWRAEDAGTLSLYLEGQPLAVKAAGTEWQKVEVRLGAGVHRVEWVHAVVQAKSDLEIMATPSPAWVDEITVTPDAAALTFAQAVSAPERTFSMSAAGSEWSTTAITGASGVAEPAAYSTTTVTGELPKVVSTTVTGPAVLSFQAQLQWGFGTYVPPVGTVQSSSVIITVPGSGNPALGYLICYVDGQYAVSVAEGGDSGWKNAVVPIPAGDHLVEWKVETAGSNTTPMSGTQAWLRKISVLSHAGHYRQWAADAGIPESLRDMNADADGDGLNNLLEYALGTDPLTRNDPAAARITLSADAHGLMGSPVVWFNAPPVQPFVTATLQVSSDLIHWTTAPNLTLGQLPTGYSRSTFDYWSSIIQTVPLTQPGSYYRLQVEVPEE